jgi:hypothetical protein
MNFQLAAADTAALRDQGAKLPVGRIFPASGKVFVPFIKVAIFDYLIAATGASDASKAARGIEGRLGRTDWRVGHCRGRIGGAPDVDISRIKP